MPKKTEQRTIRTANKAGVIRKKLLAWYRESKRDLPWRKTNDPYRIWVSEIMLQQTQVDTVIPYYQRFLERFPDLTALAAASLEEVLKVWENLGYYSRARNLHRAARIIVEKHGGIFPGNAESVMALPGIGAYTAGAILSIAFGEKIPAIDGNVRRVIARLYGIEGLITEPATLREIAGLADGLVAAQGTSLGDAGDFNQALMDLGAMVCVPGIPLCRQCPLQRNCISLEQGKETLIPVSIKKKPLVLKHATAALIIDSKGRFLILQRPEHGLLAGLWKLPGGFQSGRESLRASLEKTVWEETGVTIASAETVARVNHTFTHFRMKLHGFRCTVSGKISPSKVTTFKWITPPAMSKYAFGKADRELLRKMIEQVFSG